MKKTMQTLLLCTVALLLVSAYALLRIADLNRSPLSSVANFAVQPGAQPTNPDDLTAVVPEGKEMTFDEFQKAAPHVAPLLSPLKPTHIKRTGSRFTLTTTPTTITRQGVTVYVSGTVSCEATKSGTVISLKNIDGVEVDAGVGKMKLKEAVITPGTNDKAKVDGKLEVSRWLPNIPFSITVDTK